MAKFRPFRLVDRGEHAGWLAARLELESEAAAAAFIGPPKPRPRSGWDLAQDWVDANNAALRASIRDDIMRELQGVASERARQRSYRRRLIEYADHARALQLANTMQERHRIEAAGKIADLFEREGRHYEVRTIDRWLSRPDWKSPTASHHR